MAGWKELLGGNLQERYKKQIGLDFTILVKGKQVKAHKFMLQDFSGYFNEELEGNSLGEAVISYDITEDTFKQCLDFMYFGTVVENNEENLKKLLAAAHLLKITSLKLKCMELLEDHITVQNCVSIYQLMKKYSDIWKYGEQRYGGSMIIENASKLLTDEKVLKSMEPHTLELILQCDEVPVKNELFLFKAVFDWFSTNENGRQNHLCNMISMVRLPAIDKAEFISVVNKNKHLKECLRCKKYLDNVQDYLIEHKTATGLQEYQKEPRKHPVFIVNWNCTKSWIFKNEKAEESDVILSNNSPIKMHFRAVTFHNGCLFYVLEPDGKRFFCFDQTQNKWNELLPIPRKHGDNSDYYRPSTVIYQDQLLVVGGFDGAKALNTVDSYNFTTKLWKEYPSMNEERRYSASVVYNGSVYVIGGYVDDKNVLSSVEKFCSATNKWIMMPRMNQARCAHSACVFNDKIFVAGGYNNGMLSSVETYREEDKAWVNIAGMQCGRLHHAMFTYGESVYVFGGAPHHNKSLWEKYNEKDNKWEASNERTSERMLCKAFPIY